MPCYDGRNSYEGAKQEQREKEQEQAARLHAWLVTVITGGDDEVARLCAALRSIPEPDLLHLLRSHFDTPEARELVGWWEMHKREDSLPVDAAASSVHDGAIGLPAESAVGRQAGRTAG